MKKTILLLLCLFTAHVSFSQVNIDSLKTVFNDKSKVDSARFDAINAIANAFRFTRPDSTIYYSQQLYAEASRLNNKKYIAIALGSEGIAYNIIGNPDKAMEKFEESLKIFEETGDKKGIGAGLCSIGSVLYAKGNHDQAISFFKRSLPFSEEAGNRKMVAGALINMGLVYVAQDDYIEALDNFMQGEKICLEIGDKAFLANDLVNISSVYMRMGDFQRAIGYLERGLIIQQELGNKLYTANCFLGLGQIYFSMREYSSALKYQKSALEIYEAVGAMENQSSALIAISDVYNRQKQFDEALEYVFRAKALAERSGAAYQIGQALNSIGNIFKDKGDYKQAREYYQRSMELDEGLGATSGMAIALLNLCKISIEQRDYKQAIAQGERALKISREIGDIQTAGASAEALYIVYKKNNSFDKALSAFELFVQMRDSLQSEENQKAIIRYQVNADYEKQKAIDDLENEKRVAIETQKKEDQQMLSIAIGIGLLLASLLALVIFNRLKVTRRQKVMIEEQKKKVEQSEKYKEQFLANMSHEIRTPMHAISGMVNILERNQHPSSQDPYLSAMRTNSENLVVILNDVLDLSKIEAGKLDIESIPMKPAAVLENVTQILKYKAEEKGLALKYQIADGVPPLVMGDPTRLNQILINLVGNAIKFTEKGSVEVSLTQEAKRLKFSVKDTGIGIPKDKQESIFGAFEQAKGSTSRYYGGTGLGLSISKQLVELQDGEIWVESEEGQGSTFYVELPLIAAATDAVGQDMITEERLKTMAASLKGIRILLAEDNPFNQMIAQDDLTYFIEDVQVDTVENGALAVEKFKTGNYDLVLMDVQMPEMNGFEAARKIREIEGSEGGARAIPIIAMTASLLKKEIDNCYAAGMDNYIPKPYKPEELIGIIFKESKG